MDFPVPLLFESRWERLARTFRPTARYLMETEVHVYSFSIAASVLLSFFPFLLVILAVCHDVLEWRSAEKAVFFALRDYFPGPLASFIERNIPATRFQLTSMFLLLFTANGIFEPLEVSLNRAWGCPNRSYVRNQVLSLGMIFLCGTLALLSTTLTAVNLEFLAAQGYTGRFLSFLNVAFFKMAAVPISMLMLFFIYWLLPNRKVPAMQVAPAAILVGLLLELLKYVNLLTWPWLRLKLQREYGPFVYSVSIILWSFLASMIVLAGAEWSVRRGRQQDSGAGPEPSP